MKPWIGFIGLGKMGAPMASNLLKAGHQLITYDLREAAGSLPGEAIRATSLREVGERCTTVITMLPSPEIVELVAIGPAGLKDSMAPGSVYIDMSTTGPKVSLRIAEAMSEAGIKMLDAPVSRGEHGATHGTLSIMAGGDREVFERVLPVLDSMGTTIFYCGATGSGASTKLVNNLIQGTITGIVAEGLVLGARAGLNLPVLLKVLEASSADNFVLRHFFPTKALRGDFKPGGTVKIVEKDLGLAVQFANDLQVPSLFGTLSHQLYGLVRGRGRGEWDFTALITLFEETAGVEVRFEDEEHTGKSLASSQS